MPKRKAAAEEADYSDEDEEMVSKKKTDNKKAASTGLDSQLVCQLSTNRKVTVRKFKGKVFVDIREYYTGKTGEELPGKKGISLTLEQWDTLKEHLKDIQELVNSLD